MIFSIRRGDDILGPDRVFFKAREVLEITREEMETRIEHRDNPLPFEWSPGDKTSGAVRTIPPPSG